MSRIRTLVPLALLALIVGWTAMPRGAVVAQDDGMPLAGHPCAGSWSVLTDLGPDLPPLPVLFAFNEDGTALGTLPNPRRAVPGGGDFGVDLLEDTGMYGVWEATGDRTCAVTVLYFTSSTEGEFLVTTTLSATNEVDSTGDRITTEATLVDVDPDGDPVGSLAVTSIGTRIVVQPRVTGAPAVGTPSA